jgi:hypothetical protein
MRVRVLLQITEAEDLKGAVEEVAVFEKATERPEDLGLSITESKALLAATQHKLVKAQAAEWLRRHHCCEACGQRLRVKGAYPVLFHTLYGADRDDRHDRPGAPVRRRSGRRPSGGRTHGRDLPAISSGGSMASNSFVAINSGPD